MSEKTQEALNPELNPENELPSNLNPENEIKAPEALEKLKAPSSDMFLEEGEKNPPEQQTEVEETIKDINNSPEKHEQKEIKNVAEFLEVLEDRIMQCKEDGDNEEKMKLAFHLIKVKGSLRQAKLRPEKLSLMALSSDELTKYDRTKNKLKVRKDILDDLKRDQQFLATIFSEIRLGSEGTRDIGFQLLAIKKKMPINKEIDKKERQATERTFDNLGINKALNLYDFRNPEKLADYFLEKEVVKRLEERKKINKPKSILMAVYLSALFKKGAPELHKKLREGEYAWQSKVWGLIQKNQS